MLKRFLLKVVWLVSLSCSTLSYAELTPFKYQFDIDYGLINLGRGSMQLQSLSSQTFKLTFNAKPQGIARLWVKRLREESWLLLDEQYGLITQQYHFQLKGKENQNQRIRFNRSKRLIHSEDHQLQWPMSQAYALDRLSFPLAIAYLLQRQRPLPEQLDIAGHHHLWHVQLTDLGHQKKTIQGQSYDTRHIRATDGSEVIDFWLNIHQQYHPVEISFKSKDGWTTRYRLRP